MPTSSKLIRKQFVDFFASHGHTFVRSAPVVPQDDPTLYFTNAGMNQFKSIFLGGENKADLKRAANSQKCMRVSGKHNDLEEVGRDHYHHTFFEMLGNWSFGDYYKKEAIVWAWELLTGVWKIPKDKLYATVYKDDDEAIGLWKTCTDVAHDHIGRYDAKSNFWEMGEIGPCGPCSEIHMDQGPGICLNEGKPGHTCGVNVDGCARYMELWNLVFMQNNRQKDGSLRELPAKHIDTGMGFERVVRVIQGVKSNYDTDLFVPIIAKVSAMCGKQYTPDEAGTPFRVIADHIRSLTFAITDGAIPSNEGRGYVLRRLLRRAYRFGREIGFHGPFLHKLVPTVIEVMGEAFPEITQRRDYVADVIRSEEERFGQTLEQGILRFEEMTARSETRAQKRLSGDDVFLLYDTYGFPADLTRLMAEEKGFSIDEAGFEARMGQQRGRARDAAKKADADGLTADGWIDVTPGSSTQFTGYDNDAGTGAILRYKPVGETSYLLILDKTPFYAESGGQVGDTGTMQTADGALLTVLDTLKWNDAVVHKVTATTSVAREDFVGVLQLHVDAARRSATRRNHSATHLLQAALRAALGDHVQQSGSRVGPDGLRFDYTHFKAPTNDELRRVEEMVNEWILGNLPVSTAVKNTDEAKREGAMALFGERYGDSVRVVSMGSVSKELCGGTHVRATGDIGLFHITADESISAGVRRISGVTGMGSVAALAHTSALVTEVSQMLKVGPDAVAGRITDLISRVKALESQVAKLSVANAGRQVESIIDESTRTGGKFPWVAKNLGVLDKQAFADLTNAVSDMIRDKKLESTVVLLAAAVDGKALFAASAGQKAVKEFGVHCGEIVKAAATIAGGGGGGSPVRAQAGGKDPAKLADALTSAESIIRQKAA